MTLGWDDALSIVIPLLAIVPFAIAVAAYRRTRTTRVFLFAAAFGALFAKGLVVAGEVLVWPDSPTLDAAELVLDAAVILLFFAGMMRK